MLIDLRNGNAVEASAIFAVLALQQESHWRGSDRPECVTGHRVLVRYKCPGRFGNSENCVEILCDSYGEAIELARDLRDQVNEALGKEDA